MDTLKPTALIIDDEPDLLSLLSISLRRMGIESVKAENIATAKEKLNNHFFDLCLTDLRLPDGSGLEIVKHVQAHYSDTPIAVITAFGDPKTAVQALKSGAFDYVAKPIEVDELESMVQIALKVKPNQPSSSEQFESPKLLGESESIKHIRALIEKVARNQAPVHITGETGTGKELIARMIHEKGPRNEQPFVAVNCGAIPRELMESEFFGHKKGSFTGAHQDTDGLFKTAHGGTLFLDEVGELPKELQVKLLRAIQEKKIRAVGDVTESSIDVRIISATHKNLAEMIKNAEFREDFYYRINVIPIEAPPLRQRISDLPILIDHIVSKLSKTNGMERPSIELEAIDSLSNYPFPGNVRELENILERTMALCGSDTISKDDITLPGAVKTDVVEGNLLTSNFPDTNLPIDDFVDKVEIQRIKYALAQTNGNVTAASRILGTTFRSLRYRIKKLEIDSKS